MQANTIKLDLFQSEDVSGDFRGDEGEVGSSRALNSVRSFQFDEVGRSLFALIVALSHDAHDASIVLCLAMKINCVKPDSALCPKICTATVQRQTVLASACPSLSSMQGRTSTYKKGMMSSLKLDDDDDRVPKTDGDGDDLLDLLDKAG